MVTGIIEKDVHGMRTEEVIKTIYQLLSQATSATYRIRIIHGFHGGTRIRDGIQDEFGYNREPQAYQYGH